MVIIFLSMLNINTLNKVVFPKSIAWGDDSTIFYTSYLNSYIFKYEITNKSVSLILNQPGYNSNLSISPNGKFLVFTNTVLQSSIRIFVYNFKNKKINILSPGFLVRFAGYFSFTPDSKYICFSLRNPAGSINIYKASIDENGKPIGLEPITLNSYSDYSPICFKDTMIYASDKSGNYDIFVSVKGNEFQITHTPVNETYLSISPDRKWILFIRGQGVSGNLFIKDFNGNEYQITSTPTQKVMPIWSPVGDKIAFLERKRGEWKVKIITSDFIAHHPETVACPNCGFKNKWEYNFCVNCGKPLKDAKTTMEKHIVSETVDSFVKALVPGPVVVEKEGEIKNPHIPVKPNEIVQTPEKKKIVSVKRIVTGDITTTFVAKEKPPAPQKKIEKKAPPSLSVKPIIKKPKRKRKPLHLKRIDPTILFTVPKPNIIPSLAVILSGGTAFATQEEGFSPLGTFSVGLGDIAQVEMSTTGVINNLLKGSSVIPTIAFQMSFSEILKSKGKLSKDAYDLSIGLRGSWWNTIRSNSHYYSTRIAHLYAVFGKKIIPSLNIYGGVAIADTRIKTDVTTTEVVNNPHLFFFGAELKMGKQTNLMLEFSQLSGYNYNDSGRETRNDLVKGWWISLGSRVFLAPWIVLNMGGRFDSMAGEFQGIADTKLWFGTNIIIPTMDIIDYYAQ